jgi:hypothetical protein
VNEDIAGYMHGREGVSQAGPNSAGQGPEGIAAMKAAGWDTGGDGS